MSLADKVWKGRRVPELEQLVLAALGAVTGQPAWAAFLDLDEVLTTLAEDSPARLAVQAGYPVGPDRRPGPPA